MLYKVLETNLEEHTTEMKTAGHRKVAQEAGIPRLTYALRTYGIADDTYPSPLTSFYLGNWLTDLSQFKDPHGSFTNGPEKASKILIDMAASFKAGLNSALIEKIMTSVAGEDLGHALLDTILDNVDILFLHYRKTVNTVKTIFIDSINEFLRRLIRFTAYSKFVAPLPGKKENQIDFKIFIKIFDKRYDRYYPHEHLDRPYCKYTLNEYCKDEQAPPSEHFANNVDEKLGMYSYLQGSIGPAIGMLFELDRSWASKYLDPQRRTQNLDEEWHIGLSNLGYALHTIEDFFAHSNFTENSMVLLGTDFIKKKVYNQGLIRKATKGNLLSDKEILEVKRSIVSTKKIYKRFIKYSPGVDKAFNVNPHSDNPKVRQDFYISTGYFDGEDTTVAVLETIFDLLKKDKEGEKNILVDFLNEIFGDIIKIYDEITNKSKHGDLYKKNAQFENYLIELKSSKIEELINKNRNLEQIILEDLYSVATTIFRILIAISQTIWILVHVLMTVVKFLKLVNELEKEAAEKVFLDELKGLLKDLIFFIIKNGIETLTKEKISDDIYDITTLFFDKLGKNRIGSHSLMAKDLPDEPLYAEMFLYAKTVHWLIVDALCRWSNEKWQERSKSNKEEIWVDWEHLVFNFLRHPRKTEKAIISYDKVVEMKSFINYKTTSVDTTLKNIYENKVNKMDFSFDDFLLFNNIQFSYLLDPQGGTNINENRLKDQLVLKRLAYPTDYSYSLIEGNNILIPIKRFSKSNFLENETWFSIIGKLDEGEWAKLIEPYEESRVKAGKEDITLYPLGQFYEWKYISVEKRDDKIRDFTDLRARLENKYNESPGQPL